MEPTHKRLTPARIKAARTSGADIWLTDDTGIRGTGRLQVRVSKSGVKRFYFRPPRGREKPSPIPLGPYAHISQPGYLTLSQARALCRVHLSDQLGSDGNSPGSKPERRHRTDQSAPLEAGEREVAAPPEVPNEERLSSLCDAYADHLAALGKSSVADVRGFFRRYVHSHPIGARAAAEITSEDFADLFRELISTKGGGAAQKLRSNLSAAYGYGMRAKLDPSIRSRDTWKVKSNPLRDVAAMSEFSQPRTRALDQKELVVFLKKLALYDIGDSDDSIRAARVSLLLGGQRFEQLLNVKTADADLASQTIRLFDPKGRRKSPREHILPILPAALPDVRWFVDRAKVFRSTWLFVNASGGRLRRDRITKFIKKTSDSMVKDGTAKTGFNLSDLRRTAETMMASLEIPEEVRAQIQSHNLSGVQLRHYNFHDYLPQKRKALETWHGLLRRLQPAFF